MTQREDDEARERRRNMPPEASGAPTQPIEAAVQPEPGPFFDPESIVTARDLVDIAAREAMEVHRYLQMSEANASAVPELLPEATGAEPQRPPELSMESARELIEAASAEPTNEIAEAASEEPTAGDSAQAAFAVAPQANGQEAVDGEARDERAELEQTQAQAESAEQGLATAELTADVEPPTAENLVRDEAREEAGSRNEELPTESTDTSEDHVAEFGGQENAAEDLAESQSEDGHGEAKFELQEAENADNREGETRCETNGECEESGASFGFQLIDEAQSPELEVAAAATESESIDGERMETEGRWDAESEPETAYADERPELEQASSEFEPAFDNAEFESSGFEEPQHIDAPELGAEHEFVHEEPIDLENGFAQVSDFEAENGPESTAEEAVYDTGVDLEAIAEQPTFETDVEASSATFEPIDDTENNAGQPAEAAADSSVVAEEHSFRAEPPEFVEDATAENHEPTAEIVEQIQAMSDPIQDSESGDSPEAKFEFEIGSHAGVQAEPEAVAEVELVEEPTALEQIAEQAAEVEISEEPSLETPAEHERSEAQERADEPIQEEVAKLGELAESLADTAPTEPEAVQSERTHDTDADPRTASEANIEIAAQRIAAGMDERIERRPVDIDVARDDALGKLLVAHKLITKDQLATAKATQADDPKPLGTILVEQGAVTEDKVLRARAAEIGISAWNPEKEPPASDALEKVSGHLCRTHMVLPIRIRGNLLVVAMRTPDDMGAIDTIRNASSMRIEPLLADEAKLAKEIEKRHGVEAMRSSFEGLVSKARKDFRVDGKSKQEKTALTEADTRPVVGLVNHILTLGIRMGASDVHLEPRSDRVDIRYRVDGEMQLVQDIPISLLPMLSTRLKIMADLDIVEFRVPQDGRMSVDLDGRSIDVRVSVLPNYHGQRIVLRILDRSASVKELTELGFTDENLALFRTLISKPYGMLLVTGPTGSGKTTTLYAALKELQSERLNIMTCEDPVEYEIEGISQSQVNEKVGLTFPTQLRATLRQDPDVILVGEIRDRETAETAMRAALTGHLVLSTLHCNDAPGAIPRLLDMGVDPYLLSTCLIGITAQRLVRRLCPHCRVREDCGADVDIIESALGLGVHQTVWHARGCPKCFNRGFRGREAVHEILPVTGEVAAAIATQEPIQRLQHFASRYGYEPLQVDAIRRVMSGSTTLEEAMRLIAFDSMRAGDMPTDRAA